MAYTAWLFFLGGGGGDRQQDFLGFGNTVWGLGPTREVEDLGFALNPISLELKKTYTLNPKPETLNPNPETLTLNPKPDNR